MIVARQKKPPVAGDDWLDSMPSGWELRRLRFCIKMSPARSELNGIPAGTEVSFVPMEAVCEYGGLRLEQTRPIDEVAAGYTYFREGDIIVAKITPCFENGKGSVAEELENGLGFGTTELHVLRPLGGLDRRFLFYLTISHAFRSIGAAHMYGAGGQKRVPDDFIRDFRHPIPRIEVQRDIVAFLDGETKRITVLIARKEHQIDLLQEKRRAIISQAVTKGLDPNVPMKDSGVEWLGKIPAHWELLQLRRVVEKFVDYRGKTPEKAPSGVPLVTARNVKNGRIDFSVSEEFVREEDYDEWMIRGFPEAGDVLITTEAPLGESAQIDDSNIALAQRIILLKVNKAHISNDYLKYHFASQSGAGELWSRATGSTAIGIKAWHLKETLVTVPPLIEQNAIARHLDNEIVKIDALIAKIREGIEKLKEYRTALISAAVTGKIDVRAEFPGNDHANASADAT